MSLLQPRPSQSLVETHCHLELPFPSVTYPRMPLWDCSGFLLQSINSTTRWQQLTALWGAELTVQTTRGSQTPQSIHKRGWAASRACGRIVPLIHQTLWCFLPQKSNMKVFSCNNCWRLKPVEKRRFGVTTLKLVPNSGIQTLWK